MKKRDFEMDFEPVLGDVVVKVKVDALRRRVR